MTFEIVKINSEEEIDKLYENGSYTIVGLDLSEESLNAFYKTLVDKVNLSKNAKLYVVSGKLMNEYCGNTGNDKYIPDLNIAAISVSDFKVPIEKLNIYRIVSGAYWFNDVVDNNFAVEAEKRK